MINIVKIRASVFIPMSWTEPRHDTKTGNTVEFEGDSREFTPHAVNAMRSRIEQEVVVDFHKKEIYTYANTGITTVRVTTPGGSISKRKGKASTEGIVCTDINWGTTAVEFQMIASASNPLNELAPTADYSLRVKIDTEGAMHIEGTHDGFPCYEFYTQIDFEPFVVLHTHDFRETGDTPEALGGEMEYNFNKTL
ncbi:hypothetical protein bcgnr5372_38430 [Bacillus luti]|nr:DUF3238 domain-containing protein [Bacillus cereus]HDR8327226.1 DUF3238 domain-containing protein [Bacillus cereus]HDR8336416.1 DUF3238 domain-containing protein [Bacillus cereus]